MPRLPLELRQTSGAGCQQDTHLPDGDFIELEQAFRLRHSLVEEHGVEAFEVGQHDELLEGRVVTDIALGFGMGVAPLPGRFAEECDVEEVGFVGVNQRGLAGGDGGRNQSFPDGVGVDAVINLGERALQVPIEFEPVVFFFLEAAEFLDEVDLEFGADPHSEFERDVGVREGAAVATGCCP